jgi:hypothetical protein
MRSYRVTILKVVTEQTWNFQNIRNTHITERRDHLVRKTETGNKTKYFIES